MTTEWPTAAALRVAKVRVILRRWWRDGSLRSIARPDLLRGTFLALIATPAVAGAPTTDCAAFVDVAVVDTAAPVVQPHRTVVVRGGTIDGVYAASHPVDSGCLRIAGEGRFLIPGLVDSHVHLFGYSRGGEGDPATEGAILRMLLANGVTTAVVMEGSPATLHLRNEVRAGRLTGPTLYSTGPFIQAPDTGAPPGRRTFDTPEDVRREVEEEARLGYDFVKVHGALPAETYATLIATARRVGLPVVGHIPDNLGVDAALDSGQKMIAHAESYLQTYFEFPGAHACVHDGPFLSRDDRMSGSTSHPSR